MNIHKISEELAQAKRSMGTVLIEMEQSDRESSFYIFGPLVKRAETINKKIEALSEIIEDFKKVRFK